MVNSIWTMSKTKIGEWMWRFLAVVMMFSVAWTLWIIYQLNPPPLIMNAAFEAAAKAKVRGSPAEKQSAQGVIAPSGGADGAAKAVPAFAAASAPAEAPKEPPINPEKLKFSDTIALPDPVPNAKK
jgi:hypothetical protein